MIEPASGKLAGANNPPDGFLRSAADYTFPVFSIRVAFTRMKIIAAILAIALLSGCAEGGRGAISPESAVTITAQNEKEGATKEVAWTQANYPGSKVVRFVTRPSRDHKVYDVFWLKLADGSTKTVVFEISGFYHK